ncbi:hypothetical protein [uncultured Nitrospira sp.]|uniref:hypothetical protein n=1 Tax=uncultured Nitrospira sp. TaxID=157176 RepID=UPI0031409BEA
MRNTRILLFFDLYIRHPNKGKEGKRLADAWVILMPMFLFENLAPIFKEWYSLVAILCDAGVAE